MVFLAMYPETMLLYTTLLIWANWQKKRPPIACLGGLSGRKMVLDDVFIIHYLKEFGKTNLLFSMVIGTIIKIIA